jgi:hypothetical protein
MSIFKNTKEREEALEKMAKQQGLVLIKSKAKKRSEDDQQQYRIVNVSNIVQAGEKFDMSLDDVEKFLKERENKAPA